MINHGVMHTVIPPYVCLAVTKSPKKGIKRKGSSNGVYKNRGNRFAVGRKETKIA